MYSLLIPKRKRRSDYGERHSYHGVRGGTEKITQEQRFFKLIELKDDGCWRWAGWIGPTGYARFEQQGAHRWSYNQFVGVIPPDLQIDHLCRNRACVNPGHLETVTASENQRRSPLRRNPLCAILQRAKTHCPHGHEYTPANIYRAPGFPRRRYCKACMVARRESLLTPGGRIKVSVACVPGPRVQNQGPASR